ncbi:ERBB-3 BINDING PROTEIN 1-like [Aristolochia californica]|uniref:ERBB-3 BINDING PROTEIN 1-like n=1 Tax=Aristolochia californica TaxID=171875 RepID=UPI0035E34765
MERWWWGLFWHQTLRGQVKAGWQFFRPVFPETVPIRTVNWQCSSGLQAVANVVAAIRAGFYGIGSGAAVFSRVHGSPCARETAEMKVRFLGLGIMGKKSFYFGEVVVGRTQTHQLKQFVIDGNKVILSVSNPETRVDDAEFEEHEVSAVDIVTNTGDGKPKLLDEKLTTIYKRAIDKNYQLKMKSSRFIFSEISPKFPMMPFTARVLEEKRAQLGLVECVNHDPLQPHPVLHEKPGHFAAHIKFTILLLPNESQGITSHSLQELQPTKSVQDDTEINAWLAFSTKTKKKGEATTAAPMATTDPANGASLLSSLRTSSFSKEGVML